MSTEHTDVRQYILDTAMPIILGKGFSAVGLNEILTAADVPKGSFYHYFKSKEAFGEALLDGYFSEYLAQLETLLESDNGTGAERLMSYWGNWRDTQLGKDPHGKCLAVKLGAEVCDLSETMRTALNKGTLRVIERLAACIGAGMEDGSLPRTLDASRTALSLYALWMGASLLGKIRHDSSPFEAAMSATLQLLSLTSVS